MGSSECWCSIVRFRARLQVDQALGPGSCWLGHVKVEVMKVDFCPCLMEGRRCLPSPVMISPIVSTLKYFRHLFRAMRSRFGYLSLMKRSMRR